MSTKDLVKETEVVQEVDVKDEATVAEEVKHEFDFTPYREYTTEAIRDNGTLKIQNVVMPGWMYAKLRDHLSSLGFKRHPRKRYFYAPVSEEAEAVALKLVNEIGDSPAVVEEPPVKDKAPAKRKAARKVTPLPKPGTKSRRKPAQVTEKVEEVEVA